MEKITTIDNMIETLKEELLGRTFVKRTIPDNTNDWTRCIRWADGVCNFDAFDFTDEMGKRLIKLLERNYDLSPFQYFKNHEISIWTHYDLDSYILRKDIDDYDCGTEHIIGQKGHTGYFDINIWMYPELKTPYKLADKWELGGRALCNIRIVFEKTYSKNNKSVNLKVVRIDSKRGRIVFNRLKDTREGKEEVFENDIKTYLTREAIKSYNSICKPKKLVEIPSY